MDAVVLTGPCNKDAVAMADIFQVSDLIFTNNYSSDGIFLSRLIMKTFSCLNGILRKTFTILLDEITIIQYFCFQR